MTLDELIDSIPESRRLIDEGHLTWDDFCAAARTFGAKATDPSGNAERSGEGLELIVPGTATNVRVSAAGLALMRIVISAGAVLIPGPHTIIGWGANALNFGDACHRLYESVQGMDVDSGEFCIYLALAETGLRGDRSVGIYPTAADVVQTLMAKGIEWCGLRCRFHRRHHDVIDANAVTEVLTFLSTRQLVERKAPNTWWVR